MDAGARKAAVRRWIGGLFDKGDITVFEELGSPDYVYRAAGQEDLRGDAFTQFITSVVRVAFPDLRNSIDAQFVDGDVVITKGTSRATHVGPFGEIPATGNFIAVPWIIITRFAGDRIVEDYEVFDSLSMMRQIGAVPSA